MKFVFTVVLLPDSASVAVSETEYVPFARYVCDGFCSVDELPSPKFQDQLVGKPFDVSLNWTANGAAGPCVLEAEKSATGGGGPSTDILYLFVVPAPLAFDEIRVTVYSPPYR